MTDDDLRAAISAATDDLLIGDFIVVASCYRDDGEPRIVIHASDGMGLHSQLGMLTSALNRANIIDTEGWRTDCE